MKVSNSITPMSKPPVVAVKALRLIDRRLSNGNPLSIHGSIGQPGLCGGLLYRARSGYRPTRLKRRHRSLDLQQKAGARVATGMAACGPSSLADNDGAQVGHGAASADRLSGYLLLFG